MPVTVKCVRLFIAHLIQQGTPGSSVCSIISAISYFHKLSLVPDPTQSFLIKQMIKSIQKSPQIQDNRRPITTSLLKKMVVSLDSCSLSVYTRRLLAAMFTLSFHFGLRISEVSDSPHNIQINQITLKSPWLYINFHTFKHADTNPLPHKIKSDPSSTTCPVKLIAAYLKLRGYVDGPLFQLNNKPIVPKWFNSNLKNLISMIGENPESFSSHSFRIGAATSWAQQGVSDIQMRQLGRWKSNALNKYIRDSIDHS